MLCIRTKGNTPQSCWQEAQYLFLNASCMTFVDCHKDAFWGELQLQCSSPVFQVPLYTLKAINNSSVTQACDFCYVFFNNATKIILSSHNEL